MVRISKIGINTGIWSMSASYTSEGLPSVKTQVSRLVPPMSSEIRFFRPVSFAMYCVPTTPPAGPDRTVKSGASLACVTVIAPPPDRITWNAPWKPFCSSPPCRSSRYRPSTGLMYPSSTAVLVLSYSRYSRAISEPTDTGISGYSPTMKSRASISCSEFA